MLAVVLCLSLVTPCQRGLSCRRSATNGSLPWLWQPRLSLSSSAATSSLRPASSYCGTKISTFCLCVCHTSWGSSTAPLFLPPPRSTHKFQSTQHRAYQPQHSCTWRYAGSVDVSSPVQSVHWMMLIIFSHINAKPWHQLHFSSKVRCQEECKCVPQNVKTIFSCFFSIVFVEWNRLFICHWS